MSYSQNAKLSVISVRVNSEDEKMYRSLANDEHITLSEWVRNALNLAREAQSDNEPEPFRTLKSYI